MKRISQILILLSLIVYSAAPVQTFAQSPVRAGDNPARTDNGWPRKVVRGTATFEVYQPQIEQWHGNRLEARAAVAITEGPSRPSEYGVFWFTARTEIDKVNRLVTMVDFRVTKVSFPNAADKADLYERLLQQQ